MGLKRLSPLPAVAVEPLEEASGTTDSWSSESNSEDTGTPSAGTATGPTSEEHEAEAGPARTSKPPPPPPAVPAMPEQMQMQMQVPASVPGPPLVAMADLVSRAQALQVDFVRRTFRDPNPPAAAERSEHALWMGNVPHAAGSRDIVAFFQTKMPLPPGTAVTHPHGIVSVFVIARSKCAFVNWESAALLAHALDWAARLPPEDRKLFRSDSKALAMRARSTSVEHAGVTGQRGHGLHVRYVREYQQRIARSHAASGTGIAGDDTHQRNLSTPAIASAPVKEEHANATSVAGAGLRAGADAGLGAGAGAGAGVDAEPDAGDAGATAVAAGAVSSVSLQETTSSLLRHPALRHRFFILKSRRLSVLKAAVASRVWVTLLHNEAVLDQAYRNSQAVYLFMSANTSGAFFGVARMAGPIFRPGARSCRCPMAAVVADLPGADAHASSPTRTHVHTPTNTTCQLPPQRPGDPECVASSAHCTTDDAARDSTPSQGGLCLTDPRAASQPPRHDHELELELELPDATSRRCIGTHAGVPADPVPAVPGETRAATKAAAVAAAKAAAAASDCAFSLGALGYSGLASSSSSTPFAIDWIAVLDVPFSQTNHIRNPWRSNRPVKVSRDGTEVEPDAGWELMRLFAATR